MRKLNSKQKEILKKYARLHYFDYSSTSLFDTKLNIEKYGYEAKLLQELEKINDYETLWSDYARLKGELIGRSEEVQLLIIENFS